MSYETKVLALVALVGVCVAVKPRATRQLRTPGNAIKGATLVLPVLKSRIRCMCVCARVYVN